MINKALVLGYFGFENNHLDGQTVKTRNILDLLKTKEPTEFKQVNYFDTQSFQRSKWRIFKVFQSVIQSDIVYYLPAQNNLRFIFPFIFILSKIFNVKLHYIVIGGWLTEFLNGKPLHRWMLSKIDAVYPELDELSTTLKTKFGLKRVYQLHNFRITDFQPSEIKKSGEIKLVFMARIHPLKGVKTLFELENEIQKQGIAKLTIDVYGPIYLPFEEEFNALLSESQIVKYHGVLQAEDIYNTLQNYDLLLFPTQFYTEGFPGTILDAYISKVPVIATKWKYANEFIENNKSGKIVTFNDSNEFINETIKLVQDKNELLKLKEGTQNLVHKFSAGEAWKVLKSKIDLPS
ncbi:glycosyltransferase [Brumimicrobium oceani]|uniref:Uncharacterized protein n=1 Tax=Brumimicrobium oceani TaxID=2100725 RepID=A0A2U2XGP1_9FLAO|nr:glycosyltransferase [Brumimicrobium oceani]PWH86968.1 hypothetical protein DIT68_01540 [Brumimicrobium oceani]